jgi:HlyD family secretion protein
MKPNRRLIPVVGILAIGAIVVVTHQARNRRTGDRFVASGTAEATEAQLGFQLTGRIADIAVREGDRMKADSILATLDRSEQQARLEQTQAQLDAARALLSEMERGSRDEEIAQARASRDAAAQRMEDAKRDLDRALALRDGGAASPEAYDKARLAYDIAKNQAEGAQEQFALVRAGPRRERIDAQRAQVAQAEAAVRQIEAMLANMTIRSAFDGIVTVRHREPGEIVPAGAAVLTVMNPDDRWVRIYVPETRIGGIRLGLPAVLACDTFQGKTYPGEVSFIASQAEFTPKTVQTAEERVKLVYAVKVRITGDPSLDLKPGMPVDVTIDLRRP